METVKPDEATLLAAFQQHQKQLAYLRNYAKERRKNPELAKVMRAQGRSYYWDNRDEILARRKAHRDAKLPKEISSD